MADLRVDIINRIFGSVAEQEHIREVNQGALLKQIEALSQSGSPALDDESWDKNLKNVGLDPKAILPGYRKLSAENRGAYEFQKGLGETLRRYVAAPEDLQSQMGQEIPLTEGPGGNLSNPLNPFGGPLNPPSAPTISQRVTESGPLLELMFDPASAGNVRSSAATRQGFGPDFNRLAFEAFGEGPYTPEQTGYINQVMDAREVQLAGGKAGATEGARYTFGTGLAGGGGAGGPKEGETRAEYEARLKAEGAGRGRLHTSEKGVEERTGATTVANSLFDLAGLGARLAPKEPGLLGRATAKLSQTAQSAMGEADITTYREMKQSLATILARQAGEKGNLAEGDIKRFIDNIPDPSLPLATQIKLMQANYRRIYTMAVSNAQARGFDPGTLGLPPPESVASWYGALDDGQGNYVLPAD